MTAGINFSFFSCLKLKPMSLMMKINDFFHNDTKRNAILTHQPIFPLCYFFAENCWKKKFNTLLLAHGGLTITNKNIFTFSLVINTSPLFLFFSVYNPPTPPLCLSVYLLGSLFLKFCIIPHSHRAKRLPHWTIRK